MTRFPPLCSWALLVGLSLVSPSLMSQDRNALWKAVDDAIEQGRPQSAIEALEPILTNARDEGAFPEAIKALARKISLEQQIEGRRAEEAITRLEEELPQWPAEAQPVLETILAHWYWSFYEQNRWRFLERTQTDEPPGEDILSWDLPRILAEIDKHFSIALSDAESLQAIPIADYEELLTEGSVPDSFRPTLYDFLAQEALYFYSAGEQAGAQGQEAFSLSADAPPLSPLPDFLAWETEAEDDRSPLLKGLRLYQTLLRYHEEDENPNARLDLDLARLQFAHAHAHGPNKDERYRAALSVFAAREENHPLSARARARWATLIRSEGDLVRAREIALRGAEAFPEQPGGLECRNLIIDIEEEEVSLTTDRVWNDPQPDIRVRYKNLTKAYFRVIASDWKKQFPRNRWHPEYLSSRESKALLTKEPLASWSVDLPPTEDFQLNEASTRPPQDLEPGFYFILCSHQEDFSQVEENATSYTACWVSDLALITRTDWEEGSIGGFVLDAVSGEPIVGAQVQSYRQERNQYVEGPKAVTNKDGLFDFNRQTGKNESLFLLASHEGQSVSSGDLISSHSDRRQRRPQERTFFFTDRSLYRPGQTIRFKGLAVRFLQEKDEYNVISNRTVTVRLLDANGQEVEQQKFQTNDFGSFHGSFQAPRDRLMGRMVLMAEGNAGGQTSVNVEEYKRPKFLVDLVAPTEGTKLNEEVVVTGTASSYTGAAIDAAEVSYRVV
ncbi:MAG: MG2 domain-containing protein, partial [Verrucomicrobiota bacterium]